MANGAVCIRRVSNPITQIPSEPAGNAKETAWFRQLLRCLRERTVKTGPGLRHSYKSDGTLIELIPVIVRSGGSAVSDTRMKIVTIEDDHLTCRTQSADGTVDAAETPIKVAKPTFCRRTGIDGITRDGWSYSVPALAATRTLTAVAVAGITNGLIVLEELEPSYKVDDTIYATQPSGQTAVELAGERLTWIDKNYDARHYRHKRIMLDACVLVNNTPTQKTIIFSAGPIP